MTVRMENKVIEKKLKQIIAASKPEIKIENIEKGTQLHDYNFDSIDLMQLIVEVESEFEIEIDAEYFVAEILLDYDQLYNLIVHSLNQ